MEKNLEKLEQLPKPGILERNQAYLAWMMSIVLLCLASFIETEGINSPNTQVAHPAPDGKEITVDPFRDITPPPGVILLPVETPVPDAGPIVHSDGTISD